MDDSLQIRLLFPKLRKRSGRLGGKGAPGSARAAVLNFLGHLEPSELRPLLELLLDPLSSSFTLPSGPDSIDDEGSSSQGRAESEVEARMDAENRLLPPQWWACHLGTRGPSWWLQAVDDVKMEAQLARRKIGFLNSCRSIKSPQFSS